MASARITRFTGLPLGRLNCRFQIADFRLTPNLQSEFCNPAVTALACPDNLAESPPLPPHRAELCAFSSRAREAPGGFRPRGCSAARLRSQSAPAHAIAGPQ